MGTGDRDGARQNRGTDGRPASSVAGVSAREADVLAGVGERLTNAEIAARLYISARTAEHHVGRVLGKLGMRSRAEAAAFAVAHPNGGADR